MKLHAIISVILYALIECYLLYFLAVLIQAREIAGILLISLSIAFNAVLAVATIIMYHRDKDNIE